MIDANEFFRNATLRICGNLEIEAGLHACLAYLAKHMPADCIYLERHESDLSAMRIVARANAEGCAKMDLLVPFPEQARAAMSQLEQARREGTLPPVLVINRPQTEPATQNLLAALGMPSSSVMSLPLIVEELKIGAIPPMVPGAIDDLMTYDWPGNVRELEKLIERAMILHREGPLRFDDIGAGPPRHHSTEPAASGEDTLTLDEITAQHIRRALSKTGGKIHGPNGAGKRLGVNPNTLRYKMGKLGIPFRKRLFDK